MLSFQCLQVRWTLALLIYKILRWQAETSPHILGLWRAPVPWFPQVVFSWSTAQAASCYPRDFYRQNCTQPQLAASLLLFSGHYLKEAKKGVILLHRELNGPPLLLTPDICRYTEFVVNREHGEGFRNWEFSHNRTLLVSNTDFQMQDLQDSLIMCSTYVLMSNISYASNGYQCCWHTRHLWGLSLLIVKVHETITFRDTENGTAAVSRMWDDVLCFRSTESRFGKRKGVLTSVLVRAVQDRERV